MRTIFSERIYNFAILRWFVLALCLASLGACTTLGGGRGPDQGSATPVAAAAPPPVVAVRPTPARPFKLGLALGGGAARGFAHIGVLQVLEEQGIRPDIVVGTSAGSLVASLYASGLSPTELQQMAMTLDESSITDWSFPGRSLLKGEALAKFVRERTRGKQIEQMRLPLGIVTTDLKTGEALLLRRGDPGTAVRASSAVPAVFQPVRIGSREYVDGGLVSPVPVRFAREMGADLVIAVDISQIPEAEPTQSATQILMQTFNIMGHSLSQHELRDADVVVRPKLAGISSSDFGSRRLSILAGREATYAVLEALKARMKTARDR